MNEPETDLTAEQDAQQVLLPSAGALLKQARESSGLHIAALAVLLKVPVKKLEALETNRLDLLPDAVFIRALASSVCRTLKIDAVPILARLPQTDAPKLTYKGAGINQPFRSPGDGPNPSVWAQVSRPAVLAGLVLLLGALVLIFLPAVKTSVKEAKSEIMQSQTPGATSAATTSAAGAAGPESEKLFAPALQTSPTVAQSSAGATTANADSSSSNPNMSFTATASNPAPISTSKTLTADTSAGTATGTSSPTFVATPKPPLDTDVIVFTAKGQSWIEATDASGQVVLRRVLNTGEVAGAAGVLPLKVVIGRANETQVQIRGKAFDLMAVSKDNVARFEVK